MDFNNRNLAILFEIGDTPVYLTDTLVATWAVMAVLIVIAVSVRLLLGRFRGIPRGLQNLIETAVETMDNFALSTAGPRLQQFGGVFFSIFAFVLFSNYSSLLGLRPPTADLATTIALAIITFVMIHGLGFYFNRGRYFKRFLEPYPFFLPINLITEVSTPVSMAFRLFGNMLGGVIIIGLVYKMLPLLMRFILPAALHAFFDIFMGALQAFIFTMLSMTFIQQKVELD